MPIEITVEWVEAEVQKVREEASDDEAAHAREDDVHTCVLEQIAQSSTDPNARALALAALKTRDIDFNRWCA